MPWCPVVTLYIHGLHWSNNLKKHTSSYHVWKCSSVKNHSPLMFFYSLTRLSQLRSFYKNSVKTRDIYKNLKLVKISFLYYSRLKWNLFCKISSKSKCHVLLDRKKKKSVALIFLLSILSLGHKSPILLWEGTSVPWSF